MRALTIDRSSFHLSPRIRTKFYGFPFRWFSIYPLASDDCFDNDVLYLGVDPLTSRTLSRSKRTSLTVGDRLQRDECAGPATIGFSPAGHMTSASQTDTVESNESSSTHCGNFSRMSALPWKADMRIDDQDVCFGPGAVIRSPRRRGQAVLTVRPNRGPWQTSN